MFMESLINIYKLMSEETRLRIMMLLAKEDLCVCQLTGILEISQPTISKALTKLKDLSIVKGKRDDKFIYYSLIKENTILNNNILYIESSIEDFQILKNDRERLSLKDQLLNQCKINS